MRFFFVLCVSRWAGGMGILRMVWTGRWEDVGLWVGHSEIRGDWVGKLQKYMAKGAIYRLDIMAGCGMRPQRTAMALALEQWASAQRLSQMRE